MKPCCHDPVDQSCKVCWLADHDERYQKLWQLPVGLPKRPWADPTGNATGQQQTPQKPKYTIEQLAEMRRQMKRH